MRVSLFDGLKQILCNKWSVFTLWSIEMYYVEEFKRFMIESNSDLQSLVAFCSAKKCATIEMCVRLFEASGIVSTSGDANNNLISCCHDVSESS